LPPVFALGLLILSRMFLRTLKLAGQFLFLALLASCTEEVEVNAFGTPVNVVYCLLNARQDIQYVRIGRSYQGSQNSTGTRPGPDSISWQKKFRVYIEELDDNKTVSDIYHFSPSVNTIKDSGFFSQDGLDIYEARFRPEPLHNYNLYVYFEDDNLITSGSTTIPGDIKIIDPLPVPGRKINLQSGSNFTIRWEPAELARVYQTFLRVYYREEPFSDTGLKNIVMNSSVTFEISSPKMIEKSISGNNFMRECIEQVDSSLSVTREIVNVSFEMYMGGEELGFYYYSQSGQNNLSSSLNDYTNLTNGIGVFSSINRIQISNLELSNPTLDELAYSDKTRKLGFLDHYGKR
jgi:hypothetical protein